jgi:hypothetical protein
MATEKTVVVEMAGLVEALVGEGRPMTEYQVHRPGDFLRLQDRMFGLNPGLTVISDFTFGMVELRATRVPKSLWERNEDGRLLPKSTACRLTWP